MISAPSVLQDFSSSPLPPSMQLTVKHLLHCLQVYQTSHPHHPALASALDAWFQSLLQICRESGEVIFDLSPPTLSINRFSTKDILSPQQQDDIFQKFYRISLKRFRITLHTAQHDLALLLSCLFDHHQPTGSRPSPHWLESHIHSVQMTFLPPPLVLTETSSAHSPVLSPIPSPTTGSSKEYVHPTNSSGSHRSLPHLGSAFPMNFSQPENPIGWEFGPHDPSSIGPMPEDPSGLVPLPPTPLFQQTGNALLSETSALAQLQRNILWLYSKEAYSYFLQRFEKQQLLSQHLSQPHINPYVLLHTSQVHREIMAVHQEMIQLLPLLQDNKHRERLYRLAGQPLLALHPSLINQHLLHLGQPNHPLASWHRDLLFQCNSHQIQLLQHELLRQFEHITDETQLPVLLTLMQELINYLYLRNFEENLILFLERLHKTQAIYRADLQPQWEKHILQQIADPAHLARLFERARQPGTELTQQLLTQLIAFSLPYGIRQLPSLRLTPRHEEQIALLLLLAFHAPSEVREQSLQKILLQLDTLPDLETQEFCFSLCHYFAPKLLESYVYQRIASIHDPRLRQRLLQQAVACDTPKMQDLLQQLVKQDFFAHDVFQEEWLLLYLHRSRVIDAVSFLQQRIFDPTKPLAIRHSSIWMLGAMPNKKTLALLESIIASPLQDPTMPDTDPMFVWQAIHTLGRFAFPEARARLESLRQRASILEYAQVRQLLHDPLPPTLASLQQEQKRIVSTPPLSEHQQLLRRVWLTLLLGLLVTLMVMGGLYLAGWFDKFFQP